MPTQTTRALTIAGVTLVTGALAYAVYFDYKRRNDVGFRKNLKKQKKRVDKSIASSQASLAASTGTATADLRAALEQVKKEPVPASPEQKETYFMSQVATGEQLSLQGPDFYLPAALSFYRALRVYPSPVELMVIYQKTVPEPIFKLVIELTNLDVSLSSPQSSTDDIDDDETSPVRGGPPSETSSQEWDKVKDRVEGYYDVFPPKSLGVAIESRPNPSTGALRNVLVLSRDVKVGELIYKEHPIVGALDLDIQQAGTHCSHCMRTLDLDNLIKVSEDPLAAVYCSEKCQLDAKGQYHSLLFTTDRPLPADIPTEPITPAQLDARRKAQTEWVEYIKKKGHTSPLLVGLFIARQVGLETAKLIPGASTPKGQESEDFVDAENGEYLLADHLERLRFLEVEPPKEEVDLMTSVLQTVLPGLESFVTEERYATLLGKMAYNAYGVSFGLGRDDRPTSSERPEDQEKTRTPNGTSRQIGSAIYTVASYLSHSCEPNARPSFDAGTSELHLVANRDISKGEEINVSFVDCSQHEGETTTDARRRRRMELARGWRFACACNKCIEEAKELGLESGEAKGKDESKVEAAYANFEKQKSEEAL
ncbi:mitochondrial import receptor subunit tom20 [Marasmius tenuissimus]|uniref:Mitochondrial import receptor subunit tom20 n=1 Tax=Marasmius tenuissimus TaxID=585030 RepID=A0ABR3A806_9AGAR|nr:mitochondrial import receptor subunit tom20 [Marasmius tenuissimus]